MTHRFTTAGLAILAAAGFTAQARADEQTYWFGAAAKHTNISFVSKTDVEEILGSTNAISGARVNVAGTTVQGTSDVLGQIVFNLDAATYTLVTSPPSGYDTPADISKVITANATQTITVTGNSGGSDVGWIG